LPSISLTLNMSSTLALILMNIACMDPIIHGSAVYQARAIMDVDGTCSGTRSLSFNETDEEQELPENEIQVKATPNPNNGSFKLDTKEQLISVKVYSLTGQLMFSQNTELQVISTGLKIGIYFVHVVTENGNSKILKIEVQ
jgi:Secretion system C-terminal sorting domain